MKIPTYEIVDQCEHPLSISRIGKLSPKAIKSVDVFENMIYVRRVHPNNTAVQQPERSLLSIRQKIFKTIERSPAEYPKTGDYIVRQEVVKYFSNLRTVNIRVYTYRSHVSSRYPDVSCIDAYKKCCSICED